jgi:hypothetical protein
VGGERKSALTSQTIVSFNMIGHMNVNRKVADSIPDATGTLLPCSCGLCGYMGRNHGHDFVLGRNS